STYLLVLFLAMIPSAPSSALFPYTTLFRSWLRCCNCVAQLGRQASLAVAPWFVPARRSHISVGSPIWRRHCCRCPASSGDTSRQDRKSTRLNSSHRTISYAVFCLKKKNSIQ